MAIDQFWNFGEAVIQGGFDASATVIQLVSGGAARFPNPAPFRAFQIVVWNETNFPNPSDDPNREIMRVTSNNPGTDQLVVVRGEETSGGGLAASTKNTPAAIYKARLVITKKFFDDLEQLFIDFGEEYAYVTEFGAKGDGTTDDTDAIQDAIDAGNIVVFAPGTYLVDGGLTLKSSLRIQGSGIGVTTIRLKNSATGAEMFAGSSLTDVSFEGLTLDGNEANNSTNGHAIKINGVDGLTLVDLIVKGFRGYGLLLGADSGSTKHLHIDRVQFRNCHQSLVEISNRGSANVGNIIGHSWFEAPAFGETTTKAGIDVRGPVEISDCEFHTLANNAIGILLRNDDGTLGAGAHDALVVNCRAKGTAHASNVSVGFLVQGERSRLVNCNSGGTDRGFQFDASDADEGAMVNCVAQGNGDEGVRVGADRVLIQGCHIDGAGTGINVLSGAADTTISNNYIGATTTKVTNSGTNTHARGNRNWKTHGFYESSEIECTLVDTTVSVTLDLDVTPTRLHFQYQIARTTGSGEPAFRQICLIGTPTTTNVDIYLQATAAAASTFVRVIVWVDALP